MSQNLEYASQSYALMNGWHITEENSASFHLGMLREISTLANVIFIIPWIKQGRIT
jgi:predicted hotdog family 3-hydroxylacyl-ACP dehydratase